MSELRDRREAIVREHMESENRHEFDVTIGTFDHPRYEIVPTGDVHDGEEAVRGYFADDARRRSPTSATSSSSCTTWTTASRPSSS